MIVSGSSPAAPPSAPREPVPFPETPIDRLSQPLRRFLHTSSASGLVLLAATGLALVLANSPFRDAYAAFWSTTLTIGAGSFELSYPLWYWVNDGLMTIFFFVIGLEIKRELTSGELKDPRKVRLPILAAIGGAVIPALVFRLVLGGAEGTQAWAVPMATDIAFVVGILALLGPRVPPGLKVFLLSLAIVDDIIAVLVIAIFYSGSLSAGWFLWAGAGFGAVLLAQRIGVRSVGVYTFLAVGIWIATLKSGIHPTVAGVFLGLLTPAKPWLGTDHLLDRLRHAWRRLRHTGAPEQDTVRDLLRTARESVSPLEALERTLHPWMAFAIMPIFALANAGVALRPEGLGSPVAIAIAAGLVLGKTLGITAATALGVRSGLAPLPQGVTLRTVFAGALLSGIGFTMSLFIASLALEGAALESAKSGILLGSLAAGVGGYLLLRRVLPVPQERLASA